MGGVFNVVNLDVYHYAGNNPVKYVDPDGEWVIPAIIVYIVSKMPGKEEHHNRDQNIQSLPETSDEVKEQDDVFTRLPDSKSIYHQQGTSDTHDPSKNEKYVADDGREAVYNEHGQLVKDPVNRGTFNRRHPENDPIGHFVEDVLPYWLWGNSPDDPTTFQERVTGNYTGTIPE